jgi:hypothetical protein
VSEQSKYLSNSFNLSLLLELNLSPHERKLGLGFMAGQIFSDPQERQTGFFNFARSDQLTRGMGHEGREANEQDDSPGDLDSQG